jgi:hypothetical protein
MVEESTPAPTSTVMSPSLPGASLLGPLTCEVCCSDAFHGFSKLHEDRCKYAHCEPLPVASSFLADSCEVVQVANAVAA